MKYAVEEQRMSDDINGEYTTYAIVFGGLRIDDVATDRAFVEYVVKQLNDGEVEACHFLNVVENFLAG